MCIDIVKIWLGIADGQMSLIFNRVSARDTSVFSFLGDNFCKCQWIFTKLGMCIDIVDLCFRIADRQISSILMRVISLQYICILVSGK